MLVGFKLRILVSLHVFVVSGQYICSSTQASFCVACAQPCSHGPLLANKLACTPFQTIRVWHHIVKVGFYVIPIPIPSHVAYGEIQQIWDFNGSSH